MIPRATTHGNSSRKQCYTAQLEGILGELDCGCELKQVATNIAHFFSARHAQMLSRPKRRTHHETKLWVVGVVDRIVSVLDAYCLSVEATDIPDVVCQSGAPSKPPAPPPPPPPLERRRSFSDLSLATCERNFAT